MPVTKLAEGISLLTGPCSTLTDLVMRGQVALWLGSGISRDKFPNVESLIDLLLTKLYASRNRADPNCPYKSTLNQILRLSTVDELTADIDPAGYDCARKAELLRQLSDKYSEVLDHNVHLPGETRLLTWDILKLQDLYSDSTVVPDAEHRFVALLVLEGTVSEIVTTNWDPLVEIAHDMCQGPRGAKLQVIAAAGEWARNGYPARLFKMHGCARKARTNEPTYRPFLMATRNELQRWENDQTYEPFKTGFMQMLREHTAFFVGLSGQDWNIQGACAATACGQHYFPPTPPKVYFAELELRNSHKAVMRAIYGTTSYDADSHGIDEAAQIPAFAKTVFGSLYLITLERKIHNVLNAAEPAFPLEYQTMMYNAVEQMKTEWLIQYDAVADTRERWHRVATEISYFISRTLSLFRNWSTPSNKDEYEPISFKAADGIYAQEDLGPLRWLLFSLSLLKEGVNRGIWSITFPSVISGALGQFQLSRAGSNVSLFILNQDRGLPQLFAAGLITSHTAGNNIVIYPSERRRQTKRTTTPSRLLPTRSGAPEPTEIWLKSDYEATSSLDGLVDTLNIQFQTALIS